MPAFEDETRFFPLPDDDPHYTSIGRVASRWALFEFHVSQLIWLISATDDAHGACVTGQIHAVHQKLRALIALLRLDGVSDELLKKFNKFMNDTEPLSEKRNRIVHDPWMIGRDTGLIAQIIATANRKLDYRFRPASKEHIDKVYAEIQAHDHRFQNLQIEATVELSIIHEE